MEGDEFSFDNDYNLQVKDFQHYIFSLFKKLLIFLYHELFSCIWCLMFWINSKRHNVHLFLLFDICFISFFFLFPLSKFLQLDEIRKMKL